MTLITLLSRNVVIDMLSEIRFGIGAEPISKSTFRRWCNEIGCKPCQTTFSTNELSSLIRIAEAKRMHDVKLQTYGVRYPKNGTTIHE